MGYYCHVQRRADERRGVPAHAQPSAARARILTSMPREHGIQRPAPDAWSIDLPDAGSTWGTYINESRWSEDGSRIFVSRTVDPRVWPLLDAARPDIGALLVVAGVLAIIIGVARIVRRPRIAGRSYCRRCNHDLNAMPGERPSSPRCPECGLPLDGRGVTAGRGSGLRMARVGVPALVTVGCGVALFLTSIAPPQSKRLNPAWPVAAASAVPNWPWWRRSTIDEPERLKLRIDVIRVDADGLRLESSAILAGSGQQWVARADGTAVACVENSPDTEWVPRVAWLDTVGGRGGSVDLAPARTGFPTICGWSPDDREIVALVQFTGSTYSTRDDGTAIVDTAVMAIDPETGTVRTVGHGRGRATGTAGPPAAWQIGPTIAALGTDPRVRAVTVAAEQTNQGVALRELTVIGDADVRVIPLAGEFAEGSWGIRRAWLTTDDRVAVEFTSSSFNSDDELHGYSVRFIDLATGAVSGAPSSMTTKGHAGAQRLSPDGSRRVGVKFDRSASGKLSRLGIVVTTVDPAGGGAERAAP